MEAQEPGLKYVNGYLFETPGCVSIVATMQQPSIT